VKIVTITGCLGFIGSYVTEVCLERGWKVYGIDKCTHAANKELISQFESNKNFYFVREDICDIKWLPDCDYIINTAAETHVGNSIIDSTDFISTNVRGVKNLLEVVRHKPDNVCERPTFFQFSTDEVYGDILEGFHYEGDLLNPSNPYSASKAAADMLVQAWARTYGINYILLRPTNNYGIRQCAEKLVPLTIKMLQRNKNVRLHDKGLPVRNWLHAADTARAVITIIESGVQNEIFNVAGAFEQENKETVRKIIKEYHGTDEDWQKYVGWDKVREGQDVRYALNDDKLRALGWEPQKDFEREIENIVKHYKNNFHW